MGRKARIDFIISFTLILKRSKLPFQVWPNVLFSNVLFSTAFLIHGRVIVDIVALAFIELHVEIVVRFFFGFCVFLLVVLFSDSTLLEHEV